MMKALHARFDGNLLSYGGEGFSPHFCSNGDFFRMHLDYCNPEKERELGVYSHEQQPSLVEISEGRIVITYDRVVAEDGTVFPIGLVFTVCEIENELDFSVKIDNQAAVRINELQYPILETTRLGDDFTNDVLYLPAGLGVRAKNPLAVAQAAHSEYLSADYKNSWKSYPYPGPLSMPFLSIQSGEHCLSLSRRSVDACHLTLFSLGTGPREEKTPRLILSVSSFPALRERETVTLQGYRISLSDRDWRDVADSYRKWSNETWLLPRIDQNGRLVSKESIRHMHGWQRIIFKHQTGEIFHKYADLPRLYEEGAMRGIHHILLFGWEKECFNSREPNATTDEALGGEAALREAIRKVNEAGGTVVLYADGMLMSVTSDFYQNGGHRYTKKNVNMIEYRRVYNFSNNGNLLRWMGNTVFATGCFGTKGWRDALSAVADRNLSLGSNGLFFDELGCGFYLCFDESHEHGARIDLEPQQRVDTARMLREKLGEDAWFGSEWAFDRVSTLTDYTHGYGPSLFYTPTAYPYMFRYAFPEVKISNRFAHDEKSIYKKELNYAFVHGLMFDVGIYRCRYQSLEQCPNYMDHLEVLVALREKYVDFFVDGRFDLPSIPLPKGVWGAEYALGDKRIMTVWNDTSEEFVAEGYPALPAGGVAVWELS